MNNDQKIMEDLLLTTKGVCDLYLHGAIESDTPNVHSRLVSDPASRRSADCSGSRQVLLLTAPIARRFASLRDEPSFLTHSTWCKLRWK